MLSVDLPHVGHIKGIFFTGAAPVHIHLGGAFLQDIQDQVLGSQPRLRKVVPSMIAELTMVIKIIVTFVVTMFGHAYFSRYTSSRCHNHARCDEARNRS
jgi:hypothetical protein